MRLEERERIRQDERADEWRREDHRFQLQMMMMMMMMMNPSLHHAPVLPSSLPMTQPSQASSPASAPQFDEFFFKIYSFVEHLVCKNHFYNNFGPRDTNNFLSIDECSEG